MIVDVKGNLLDAEVEALVNPVNTVGVMGKGLALAFKKAYPDMFAAYASAAKRGELKIGEMDIHRTLMGEPKFIINFPTKKDWRDPSKIEFIKEGLRDLIREVALRDIQSIAIPPLGCGLGGLNWAEVRPLIEDAFETLPDVRALLYSSL
jgi:O-acetyl-ADP-ribose deacetylase (regulator of RNase III)